jgi:acetoin utilization protein AcuB
MMVSDLMTTSPITVGPETPLLDARQLMIDKRFRHVLIDLPSPATSLSVWEINYLLARLTVESVMTTSLVTVSPRQDTREAARLMLDHKIGAVVDGGQLVGIITETDLLRAYLKAS